MEGLSRDFGVEGLDVPRRFYLVLRGPAPLAGMAYPSRDMPWPLVRGLGIGHVLCLCGDRVDYTPRPLEVLGALGLQDLHGGNWPDDPAREEELVHRAVGLVNGRLDRGEGVVVHCVGGTGRTGTVLGCVLRSRGYAADEVLGYLDDVNRLRGRRGWPESPWQADMVRRF